MAASRLTAIQSGLNRSTRGRLARLGLAVLSPLYRLAIAIRNATFDLRLRRSSVLPRPTMAVGNLTAGGTGKTPVTVDLARRLTAMGYQPAILLRGYKGKAGESDEASLYRQVLATESRTPAVVAHASRVTAASEALRQQPETDVFLLDDAFQRRQVHRDLNLLLVDAICPFGFGRLLPRGLLREPMTGARRADAVLVTRCDQVEPAVLSEVDVAVEKLTGRPPTGHVTAKWNGLTDGREHWPIESLAEQTVAGVCGVGNPAAFERTLRQTAGHICWCHALPDHASPSRQTLLRLLHQARQAGAAAVVTTEKDWVKWAPLLPEAPAPPLPVWRVSLAIDFRGGEQTTTSLLAQCAASMQENSEE